MLNNSIVKCDLYKSGKITFVSIETKCTDFKATQSIIKLCITKNNSHAKTAIYCMLQCLKEKLKVINSTNL